MTLGFGRSTFRFAARPGDAWPASPRSRACAWRRATRVWSRRTSPSTGSRAARWCRWTARSRRRSPWASPTSSPTSSRRARRCAARASRSSATRSCSREAVLIRRVGAGEEANDAAFEVLRRGCRGRHGPHLRHDRLRRAGEPRRRGRRITPGLESPTVSPLQDRAWVAVRAMVPRSMTQPGHGRALRPRRPRHPRHRHRGLPALSRPSPTRTGLDVVVSDEALAAVPQPAAAGSWRRSWRRVARWSSSASSRCCCPTNAGLTTWQPVDRAARRGLGVAHRPGLLAVRDDPGGPDAWTASSSATSSSPGR